MSAPRLQTFTAIILPCEEGGFTSACLEVNGAVSQGETEEEAFENLKEATLGLIQLNAELKAEADARRKPHLKSIAQRRRCRKELLRRAEKHGKPTSQKSFELRIA